MPAARVLYDYEVEDVLFRHPEIAADAIPSSGLRIEDKGRDLLVGVVWLTGKIRMVDITAYNDDGERLDPALVDESWVQRWVRAIYDGAVESVQLDIVPLVKLGLTAVIGYFVWKLLKK